MTRKVLQDIPGWAFAHDPVDARVTEGSRHGPLRGKAVSEAVHDMEQEGGIGTPNSVMMPTYLTGEALPVGLRRTAVIGSSPQSGRTSGPANL